jgi:hypothetical protein
MLLQRQLWKLQSSGIQRRVFLLWSDVSGERNNSIFRAKNEQGKVTNVSAGG